MTRSRHNREYLRRGRLPCACCSSDLSSTFTRRQTCCIHAFARCVNAGHDLTLRFIGDGRRRQDLEALAAQLNCRDRIVFAGQIASTAVVAELDQADLFVLPSRHEGLPRAMIEAMARALPCIGSDVAGFPELLPPSAIVPNGNLDALTSKLCR